jgi:hypothetical protein
MYALNVIYSNILITLNFESSVVTVAYNQKDISASTEIKDNNFMLGIRFENLQLQDEFQKYFQVTLQNWSYDYQAEKQINGEYIYFE